MMKDSPPKAKKRPSPSMSRSNSASAKFFRCFKPAVVDDGDGGYDGKRGSDEPLFSYVAAADENDGRALQKIPPADKGDDGSDDRGKKKKKKKGLKLFSRASMAVFFEASLAKKMQKRKSTKNSHESINNLSTEADRILKLMHQNSGSGASDNDNVQTTESDASTSSGSSAAATFSPPLGSSSRSSSTNSSLRGRTKSSTPSGSFNSKQIQLSAVEDGKDWPSSSSDNSAICLLLLTLLVLVLWGKVCAIVCTSTWLFFVPRWSMTKCSKSSLEENGDDSLNVDSAEYKKKIILEGLLQRKRSRRTPYS